MARILVIEDEKDLREILAYNLKDAGHEVRTAGNGKEGLRLASEGRTDLVLLDLMLPDVSGTDICRTLKADEATKRIQIVMLTAKGEEIDRVIGFELGADDYVVKPFSVRELLLRVRAVLRRTEEADRSRNIDFGRLLVDRDAHRVWVEGAEIDLTPIEFNLLETLYDRRNRVQTREMLLDDVWGIEADITTRTVDAHVKRLREKLGAVASYILTIRGVGYRFADSPDEAEG
jgi:two-component system, OmpR family, phosphate regulon response regulator PhoB